MKTALIFLMLAMAVCSSANAQVVPAATGPTAPTVIGKPTYAVRYAEGAQFMTGQSSWQTSTVSGTLDYASASERHPFALDYAGGYTWTLTGPAYGSGQFHHLFLSQGAIWRKWKFMGGDDVSYLPQSPTTGFSGIPGIGEPIGTPNPAPATSQTILTLNTPALENVADGELEHDLNGATALRLGGNYGLLRYPYSSVGLENDTASANAEISHRFSGRNSMSGRYVFSNFSYPGYNVSFDTNTAYVGVVHRWTRNLDSSISAGPQFASSSVGTAVPSSISVAVNANINYLLRFTTAGVTYTRGANSGGGFLVGGEVDSVKVDFSRQLGMNFLMGLTSGYERTDSLNNTGTIDAAFGGAQGTWLIGRKIIVFANYTGTTQSSNAALPTNALNTLLQVVSFGVGYSPRDLNRK